MRSRAHTCWHSKHDNTGSRTTRCPEKLIATFCCQSIVFPKPGEKLSDDRGRAPSHRNGATRFEQPVPTAERIGILRSVAFIRLEADVDLGLVQRYWLTVMRQFGGGYLSQFPHNSHKRGQNKQ